MYHVSRLARDESQMPEAFMADKHLRYWVFKDEEYYDFPPRSFLCGLDKLWKADSIAHKGERLKILDTETGAIHNLEIQEDDS